jgi:23S rRNA maturation mini-RNase III
LQGLQYLACFLSYYEGSLELEANPGLEKPIFKYAKKNISAHAHKAKYQTVVNFSFTATKSITRRTESAKSATKKI